MNPLTHKQTTEMARFLFSVMNIDQQCIIKTGNNSEVGKCFLGIPGDNDSIQECMAIAFTSDGENAFGITFDGEFIFYNRQNMIKGSPFIWSLR